MWIFIVGGIALLLVILEIKVIIKAIKWLFQGIWKLFQPIRDKNNTKRYLKELEHKEERRKEVNKQVDTAWEEYMQNKKG